MALSLGALLPWGEDDLDLESLPEGHLSLDALLAQHSTPGWSLPQHGAGTVTAVAQQQRCLDGTHPQGCGLCSAPPDRDDAVEFLSGSFKALRGQLLSCREWDSAAVREAAAAAEEARGDALGLADVLRHKRGSALHQAQMLALCRVWGYKSDIWKPKAGRARKRALRAATQAPEQQPPAVAQLAVAPPRLTLTLPQDSASIADCIAAEVTPRLGLSSNAFTGPRSRARTLSTSEAAFTAFSLREYAAMEAALWSLHVLGTQASAAPAAVARLPQVAARASEPAHLALPLCGPEALQASTLLDRVQCMLSSGLRLVSMQKQLVLASGQPAEAALDAAHADWSEALESGLAGFARAHAFLSWQRTAAPLSAYLTAATLLSEEVAKYLGAVASAFAARAAWSSLALQEGAQPLQNVPHVVPPNTLTDVPGHGPLPSMTAAIVTTAVRSEQWNPLNRPFAFRFATTPPAGAWRPRRRLLTWPLRRWPACGWTLPTT